MLSFPNDRCPRRRGPVRATAVTLLVGVLCAAALTASEPVHWEGRLELGEAFYLLELDVTAPGRASAWLTGADGRRLPTAIEAFDVGPEEVTFRLPELDRGYAFEGMLVSPTRIEGALEPVPPEVPSTDLYLVPVLASPGAGDGSAWELGAPRNLTDRPGYDNQPRFLTDGDSLLYTSIRDDQADIYRYDLASGAIRQVTDTPESEYSPTPLGNGGGFSTVRVEADGTQRLWAFDLDGSHPRLLLPDVAPVGYHAWIDTETVALFVLGEPPTLEIAGLDGGETERLAEDIGRCMQTLPRSHQVLFVAKGAEDGWRFAVAGPDDPPGQPRLLSSTRPGREDFVATDSQILMADGTALFVRAYATTAEGSDGSGWRQIADFGDAGLGDVSRLALAPDRSRLVLVAERPDPSSPTRIPLTLVRTATGSD